jgi:hypothetical protein
MDLNVFAGGRVHPQAVAVATREDEFMHVVGLDHREPEIAVLWNFTWGKSREPHPTFLADARR